MKKYVINGKNRIIPKSKIKVDADNAFVAYYYYGCFIEITLDEEDLDFDKPWYAVCNDKNGATIVDGWVGTSKEHAIEVCLRNIFYTSRP